MNLRTLKEKYRRFVTNGLDENTTDPVILQRVRTLNLTGSCLVLIALFWFFVDTFYYGKYIMGIIEIIGFVVGVIFLILQRRSQNFSLTTNIGFILLSIIIIGTIIPVGLDSSEILWIFLLPPFAFFITGLTGGMVWTLITSLILGAFAAAEYLGYYPPSRETVVLNLFLSYLSIAVFSYLYERARLQAFAALSTKNEELQRIIYTVSHDLKSPVVSLLGYLSFVKEEIVAGEDELRDSDLAKMEQICHNMKQMIDDLLDLSRIKREGDYAFISSADIVMKVLNENESQLRSHNINTELRGAFPTLYIEERKLEEIIRNLLSNAIKYMGGQSAPSIIIGVKEQGEEYLFYMQDNGIGIDKSEIDKIFVPFYSKAENTVGTGIGLSIVRGFVKDLGGRIWVESEKGKGSTFWFSFPKHSQQELDNAQKKAKNPQPNPPSK